MLFSSLRSPLVSCFLLSNFLTELKIILDFPTLKARWVEFIHLNVFLIPKLDLHVSISNGFQTDLFHPKFMISAMTDFDIINVPFLDGDVPHSTSYGV